MRRRDFLAALGAAGLVARRDVAAGADWRGPPGAFGVAASPDAADAPDPAWAARHRGSWARSGTARAGDVSLAACEIVVAEGAPSPVAQAARFLAADLAAITGRRPAVAAAAGGAPVAIRLVSVADADAVTLRALPAALDVAALRGQWEAHRIITTPNAVWLVGADARGTAFAAYTLAERLGIDPLYLWTGYRPARVANLTLAAIDHTVASPTVRYRGLFHDDEDILPRPFEASGYPLRIGDVPTDWYARFFETALRLRMNMVAPYARAHRRHEVQQLASDWGLFYTSHHYDVLLSNPFGIERFHLAAERGVAPTWDWFTNRDDMLRYWRGGVTENRDLHAIWPVGLRGTDDHGYTFPEGTSQAAQDAVFRDVIAAQVRMVHELARADDAPTFSFTLYTEMLERYRSDPAAFGLSDEVIVVWPDDNSGHMRALPAADEAGRHGVYYHLAYNGNDRTMQSVHVVSPALVVQQFRSIVAAGATAFVLVNVTELREFVMEARLIAEIGWDAPASLAAADTARRYTAWWSREYFGDAAASTVTAAYDAYHALIERPDRLWFASDVVVTLLDRLYERVAGTTPAPLDAATTARIAELATRRPRQEAAQALVDAATSRLGAVEAQFLHEHVALGLALDARTSAAALELARALSAPDDAAMWREVRAAMAPLERLETEIHRAERPPFDQWYRKTWIRREARPANVHRAYEALRTFLASGGRDRLAEPENARFLSPEQQHRYFPPPAP